MALVKKLKMPSCAIEIKLTKTGYVPFDAVVPHQVAALTHTKHGQVVFKIPDFGGQNPFDAFVLANAPAFVVIVYYTKFRTKWAVFIDIDDWIKETQKSDRKSLTFERAGEIGSSYEL